MSPVCGSCRGQTSSPLCTCFILAGSDECAGPNYVDLPGVSGNFISTPDSPEVSITGDIDIRAKVAMDDWTPSGNDEMLVTKSSGPGSGWRWSVDTNGTLKWTHGGSFAVDSTVVTGFIDGTAHWIRVTRDTSSGDVEFFTSDDGATWTQLGATVSTSASATPDDNDDIRIGAFSDGTSVLFTGDVFYAEIRDGIDGPVVARFDADAVSPTAVREPDTVDSDTGETWTLNGSLWEWGVIRENCTEVTGNGSISAPFQFHPSQVPSPRPFGYLERRTDFNLPAFGPHLVGVTVVPFDSTPFNIEGGMTDLAASPTRLTAPADGFYLVGGYASFKQNGAGNTSNLSIHKNGLLLPEAHVKTDINSTTFDRAQSVMVLIDLVEGDYVELGVAASNADFVVVWLNNGFLAPPSFWAQWIRNLS